MKSQERDVLSLSQQQQRLWLLTQETGQTFWIQASYRISCKVDPPHWHQALQTSLIRSDLENLGIPEGEVSASSDLSALPQRPPVTSARLSWHTIDLRGLSEPQQSACVKDLEREEQTALTMRPDLLLRYCLIHIPGDRTLCLYTTLAISMDRQTLQWIQQETLQIYQDMVQDTEAIPYTQFTEWQDWLLTSEEHQEGEQFWRTYLQHAPSAPTHFPLQKTLQQSYPALPERQSHFLVHEHYVNLRTLAEQKHYSLQSIILTCWCEVLRAYHPTASLLLGLCTDGRTDTDIASVLGPCSRLVPFVSQFATDTTLDTLLPSVHSSIQLLELWQDYCPLISGQPPIPSSFPLHFDYVKCETAHNDMSLHSEIDHCIAWDDRISVKLVCLERGNCLQLDWYYNAQVCAPEELAVIVDALVTCLERLAQNPTCSLRRLYAPSETMVAQLLARSSGPYLPTEASGGIHHLFEMFTQLHPDRIALHCEDLQLSYTALDNYASHLAQALLDQQVKSETRVALFLDQNKRAEAIICLLAILKAGGAYVPLHPAWPRERLNMVLQASRCQLVLTQQSEAEALAWCPLPLCKYEDGIKASIPTSRPPVAIDPEHLAYIIYTSGSTGQPKGIAVEHRQIQNYTQALLHTLPAVGALSFAWVSPLATDLGNTAIFGALGSGGCLHCIIPERAKHAAAFEEYMSSRAVECLKITPSHLASLFLPSRACTILPSRFLLLGGEALPWYLVDSLCASGATCEILNHYGPTETTVGCLVSTVSANQARYSTSVPLGHPLPNMEVLILDEDLRPAAIGRPGELYIGGEGVSRGYWDKPDTTARQFFPHPYPKRAGRRLYKTGDRGRLLPDGSIEFLGRSDLQVKIHGYRLELAEIEYTLAQHPTIQDAIVQAHQRTEGDSFHVIAYVRTTDTEQPLDRQEILSFIRGLIPDYALPEELVVVQAWPLLANGKIDRAMLPIPEPVHEQRQIIPPGSAQEKRLVQLCAEVLKRTDIGVTDNFFALGGDSITGIQLIARANQQGMHLTPKQLFAYQTISELARIAEVEASDFIQEQVNGEVPFTPWQQHFLELSRGRPFAYYDLLRLDLTEAFSLQAVIAALRVIINHHDMLRMHLQRDKDRGWRQVVEPVIQIDPLQIRDLSQLTLEHQQQALQDLRHDLLSPVNSEEEPALFSLILVLCGQHQRDRLYIRWHYLIADAFSMRIILEDFILAYQQFQQKGRISLPFKTTSFQRWAVYLETYAQTDEVQRSLSFWLPLTMPSALPDQQQYDHQGQQAIVSCQLAQTETQYLLHHLVGKHNISLDDVLIAALTTLLCSWENISSVQLDLEQHGRQEEFSDFHLERTVGRLAYRFPVQLHLPQEGKESESLQSIAKQLHEGRKRGLSYGLLRYYCSDPTIARRMQQIPPSRFAFNNIGQLSIPEHSSTLFQRLSVETLEQQAETFFPYCLRLVVLLQDEQLHFSWQASKNWIEHDVLLSLTQEFLQLLRVLTATIAEENEDVGDLHLSQEELNEIINQYGAYFGGEQ